jgi:hypothetical protein
MICAFDGTPSIARRVREGVESDRYLCPAGHDTLMDWSRGPLAPPPPPRPLGGVMRYCEFATQVQSPPSQVRALLADPEALPRLHPLIDRVTVTGLRSEGGREVVDFQIDERVPLFFGLLRVPNRYHGQLRVDPARPGRLELSGWSKPAVRIEVCYEVDGQEQGPTLVEEHLWYSAPAPLRPFVARVIEAAHLQTLRRLAEVLTAERSHRA